MENPNVHKLFAITFIFIWFCFFTGCAPASHPSLMGSPTPEKLFFPSISPTVLPISPTLLPESPPVISLENANQLTPFLTWKSRINFVSWSPNGSYIGISTINNANEYGIYVLDVYRLQFIQYIGNANGTMAFSPYESLMVSDDGIINLWEVNTGELLRSYEGNAERYVVFNSATSILLVETYPFSSKTQIRLWNTKTGERTNTVELDGLARNISYDYSASILALPLQMENKSYIVVVWDVNQQKQVCSIPDNLYAEFIQTNDSLAVSNGKEISFWDVRKCELSRKFQVEIGPPYNFTVNPDGNLLVFDGGNGIIKILSAIDGSIVAQLKSLQLNTNIVKFNSDGHFLLTLSNDNVLDNQTLAVWQVSHPSLGLVAIPSEIPELQTPLVPINPNP